MKLVRFPEAAAPRPLVFFLSAEEYLARMCDEELFMVANTRLGLYRQAGMNVVNYITEQELPSLCGTDPAYSRKIKALLSIIASSVPFEIDITKLAKTIGLARNSVIAYLQNLDKAELIKLLYSDLMSIKKMQKPDKIYIQNTNLLNAIVSGNVHIGTIRETFVINQLSSSGHEVEYGRSAGDFVVDGRYTFEVGGPDKTFRQIAGIENSYILADRIEFVSGNKLPLWLIGMIY